MSSPTHKVACGDSYAPRESFFNIVLCYLLDIMYGGHIFETLGRLWIAHHDSRSESEAGSSWKAFDDTRKESCRSMGVMASLLASASAALLVVPYVTHQAAVALLFATLSCSVISAFSAMKILSAASYLNPAELEKAWKFQGIIFVIWLVGPAVWLNHALWCFKMSLLAIVWTNDNVSAKIVVTALMGFGVLQPFVLRLYAYGLTYTLSTSFGVKNLTREWRFAPKKDSESKERQNEKYHGPVDPESNPHASRSRSTSLDKENIRISVSGPFSLPYNQDDNQDPMPSEVYTRSASRVGTANFASLARTPSYGP